MRGHPYTDVYEDSILRVGKIYQTERYSHLGDDSSVPARKVMRHFTVPRGYDQLRGETALPSSITLKKTYCEDRQRHHNMGAEQAVENYSGVFTSLSGFELWGDKFQAVAPLFR